MNSSRKSSDTHDALSLIDQIRAIAREEARAVLAEQIAGPRVYDQRDGRRPPWAATKNVFLRRWSELDGQGHVGVSRAGKLRLMTEAASEDVARRLARRPAPTEPRSVEADVLAELGAKRIA